MPRLPLPPTNSACRVRWRLESLEDRIAPATFQWDGRPDVLAFVSPDNEWTTGVNWVGDVAPTPGSDLVFPAGAVQPANVNDFPAGTAFRSITFTGYNYVITGNRVTLSAGVNANLPTAAATDADPRLGLDLSLAAPQTFLNQTPMGPPFPFGPGFTITGTIDLNGNQLTEVGTATFAGPVIGGGGLVHTGDGLLVLSGNNTYSGVTDIRGVVRAHSNTALGATGAGNETVVAGLGILRVIGNGTNIAEAITFGGASLLFVEADSTVTLSGPLTLAAPGPGAKQVSFTVDDRSTLTITRGVGESTAGNQLIFGGDIDADTTVIFAPSSVNTYTGGTALVNNVRVFFDGQASATGILNVASGIAGGTGTVGTIEVGASIPVPHLSSPVDSRVAPGDPGSSGTLTTGDFTLNRTGQLVIDLGDLLRVQGTVTLAGFLDLRRPDGEPAVLLPPGTRFRIIDNDGSDPVQGTFARLPEGAVLTANRVYRVTYRGGDGNDVELVTDTDKPALAVGAGEGGLPLVNVYGVNLALLASFTAYDPRFTGGVRVATADVTGDGVEDLITGAGPTGGPHVKVFDGATLSSGVQREVASFMAYDLSFTGGVFVAAGDVTGDGFADIVTGPGSGGGPHIKVFSGRDGSLLGQFMAYDPSFRGGATVGIYGTEIVTGPGPGGGPHVRVFSSPDGTVSDEFNAFEFSGLDPNFRGGIFVSSLGSINGNSADAIVVGAGAGQSSQVVARFVINIGHRFRATLADFTAYDPRFLGGARVAAADVDGDGVDEVITGAGPGGGPHVEVWNLARFWTGPAPVLGGSFFAFDPAFRGGLFVG